MFDTDKLKDKEAISNLERIKEALFQKWGDNCAVGPLEIIESPYPEFELPIVLYGRVEADIYYDRSTLDIGLRTRPDEEYDVLQNFTDRPVFRGRAVLKGNNLEYDLDVLDEAARRLLNL